MRRIASRLYNKSAKWFHSYSNLNVIIGNANQGPSLTPIFVENYQQLSNVLNLFGKDSDLFNAAYETYDGSSAYCFIRLNGRPREIDVFGYFKLISIGSDELFNTLKIEIAYADESHACYFVVRNNEGQEITRYHIADALWDAEKHTYASCTSKLSIGALVAAINADAELGVSPFFAELTFDKQDILVTSLVYDFEKSRKINNYDFGNTGQLDYEEKLKEYRKYTMADVNADNSFDALKEDYLKSCLDQLKTYDLLSISLMNFRYDHKLTTKYLLSSLLCGKSKPKIQEGDNYISLSLIGETECVFEKDYFINGIEKLKMDLVAIDNDKYTFHISANKEFVNIYNELNAIEFVNESEGAYLYKLLSDIAEEKIKFGVPIFFNIGIPYRNINPNEYESCLGFISSLGRQHWSPYVNIVLDSYKTSLYSEEENDYLSNGVPLVTKAVNNITDFDGITGYISEQFSSYNPILTDEEKISLNGNGILTTNLMKNKKSVLSCDSNLLKVEGKILGCVSNAYLIRDLIQKITLRLNAESSYGEIKTTIDSLMSDDYADIIRQYNLDIESKQEKKEINRAVRLELYIVGFIKGLQTTVYLG